MVVFPGADLSAAAGNPFLLGAYQSVREDGSPYGDKEKYEHSKWHVRRRQALHFFHHFRRRSTGKGYCAKLRQRMVPRYCHDGTLGSAANALDGSATPQLTYGFDNEVPHR